MATSIPASANSAANIMPVGPPPAITTACLAIRHPSSFRFWFGSDRIGSDRIGSDRRFCAPTRALMQAPNARYSENDEELMLPFPCSVRMDKPCAIRLRGAYGRSVGPPSEDLPWVRGWRAPNCRAGGSRRPRRRWWGSLAPTRYRGPVSSSRVPGGVVHKLPGDMRKALIANPMALDAWKDITPLARNEFICWVEDAKQEMTRERRIRRTEEELEEGQRRPCCWPGCKHRERTGG